MKLIFSFHKEKRKKQSRDVNCWLASDIIP